MMLNSSPEQLQIKSFQDHLLFVNKLLLNGIPFAFNRISDGELYMLNNVPIELRADGASIGRRAVNRQNFHPWDHKDFNPDRDNYLVNSLKSVLNSKNPYYLLGLPCPCCCNPDHVSEIRAHSRNCTQTWANLLVNANYKPFIETTLPILQERRVMCAINYRGSTDLFSGQNPNKFNIPDNVIQMLPEVLEKFLNECSRLAPDTVVLVGASAAAKVMIHQAFDLYPRLSFIDIGTTLNPLLGLGMGRDYLRTYWKKSDHQNSPYAHRVCIW